MKNIPIRQLSSRQKELLSGERFKIRPLEDILSGNDLLHDLHRHDFFFMLVIEKGEGSHEIDFTTYKILDHAIFFIRPGQVHKLELKAASTGYLVEFNAEFYQPKDKPSKQRLRKASNKDYCEIDIDRFNKLQAVLHSMFHEYTEREEGYIDIIKANLEIFFTELVRQSQHPGSKKDNVNVYPRERFEEFIELLDEHIASHKQVSAYTGMMNLSAYQLNEITKSSVGKTASEMINEQILLEAKRYLLATPNQVKDIAYQLGYEDPSYFIRFFKKHAGHSPDAFRKLFS